MKHRMLRPKDQAPSLKAKDYSMKRTILCALWALLSLSRITAEPYLHLAGGVNLSSMSYRDSAPEMSSLRTGFNCGIRFQQSFSRYFSLLTGFSLETRGQTQTQTLESVSVTQDIEERIHLLSLQVPVLFQLDLPVGRVLKIIASAGPTLGALLAGEKYIERCITPQGGDIVVENDTLSIARNMSMLDCGILCGAGAELLFGQFGVYVKPEYYLGLTDFVNGKKADGEDSVRVGKHRNLAITAGVMIGWKSSGDAH
jgi:hypothetical protein